MHIKGEHRLIHNMKAWQKKNASDVINDISEYVTLLQLMESLGNVNHAISIVGYWIFESNYAKSLFLTQ